MPIVVDRVLVISETSNYIECDDCWDTIVKNQCMNFNSKTNKKIIKSITGNILNPTEINKKLSETGNKKYLQ